MVVDQPSDKALKWPCLYFFVFAYVWSWAWWLPVVINLKSNDSDLSNIPSWILPFILLGGYGPVVSAIFMTVIQKGRAGLKQLFSRFLKWRAPILVHFVVWFGFAVFLIVAMLLQPASTEKLGELDWNKFQMIPMVMLAGLFFGPLGEELGWRGYALPNLQRKYSALFSSVILGVVWCFWHTPLFWAPGGTLVSGQEVTLMAVGKYLLFACGLAIVFTWVFNNSKGSVLLAVAFHSTINASIPLLFFPSRNAVASLSIQWWTLIPVGCFAITLIVIYGPSRLRKEQILT